MRTFLLLLILCVFFFAQTQGQFVLNSAAKSQIDPQVEQIVSTYPNVLANAYRPLNLVIINSSPSSIYYDSMDLSYGQVFVNSPGSITVSSGQAYLLSVSNTNLGYQVIGSINFHTDQNVLQNNWDGKIMMTFSNPFAGTYGINMNWYCYSYSLSCYIQCNSTSNQCIQGYISQTGNDDTTKFGFGYYAYNDDTQQVDTMYFNFTGIPPSSFDWRTQNILPPVQNQQLVGDCWAYAATESLSALSSIYSQPGLLFSQQQLIDCSSMFDGVNGGNIAVAFVYVQFNGIVPYSIYPTNVALDEQAYASDDSWPEQCQISGGNFKIRGQNDISDCQSLKQAVLVTPVAVAINISNDSTWKIFGVDDSYNWGSLTCGTGGHAVLLVGFTETSWILQNSWGSSWGSNGYFQLLFGQDCGICDNAAQPYF